jgi:hypothetical protein
MFKVEAIIFSLVLIACTASNTSSDIKGLIFPSQCTNACWTGIQPKVTDKEQTLSILTNRYGLKNITPEAFNNQTRFVNWITGQQDWSIGGTVSLIDNRVVDISIRLKEKITAKDFIESIGEPTFVNGVIGAITSSSEFKCAGITLLYPEFGLVAHPSPYKDTLGIYESQYITFLRITEPWKREDIPWTDSFNIPWDGYREYCQMS